MIITADDLKKTSKLKKEKDVLRVIYYNVYGYGKLDCIPDRITMQSEMIFSFEPDIICLQEFDRRHRVQATELFSSRGYTEAPVNGNSVLYNSEKNCEALFFNPQNLVLLSSGGELFSDEIKVNDVTVEGNNGKTKAFTWAHFRQKSGTEFLTVNTHLMWDSPRLTLRQATSVRKDNLRHIFSFLSRFDRFPVILGGDLNSEKNSVPYKMLSGRFTPACDVAKETDNYGFYDFYAQFNGNEYTVKSPEETDDAIDHVFVRGFDVLRYTTVTCPAALISSDHLPKMCDIKATNREK